MSESIKKSVGSAMKMNSSNIAVKEETWYLEFKDN